MHEKIVELLSHDYQHVLTRHFIPPLRDVRVVSALLLATMVAADVQEGIPIDRVRLLFNQVLRWYDEDSLLLRVAPLCVVLHSYGTLLYLLIDSSSLLLCHLGLTKRYQIHVTLSLPTFDLFLWFSGTVGFYNGRRQRLVSSLHFVVE